MLLRQVGFPLPRAGRPKRPREVFGWTFVGVGLTIAWLWLLSDPLAGALYVKRWTDGRKARCADYGLVAATGNLTDECVGLEGCACNLRWSQSQGCGAPQTRWGPDAATVIPDRTCACSTECSAAEPPPGRTAT